MGTAQQAASAKHLAEFLAAAGIDGLAIGLDIIARDAINLLGSVELGPKGMRKMLSGPSGSPFLFQDGYDLPDQGYQSEDGKHGRPLAADSLAANPSICQTSVQETDSKAEAS